MTDVTRILDAIEQGHDKATDELLPLVYEELRILASQKLSNESPGQTLQATALVHEAYLRLVGNATYSWDNRRHFFAAAAEAMRRILIEIARHKRTQKQGGACQRIDLENLNPAVDGPSEDLIALDEALHKLEEKDQRKADLVKLRYFAGLTGVQAARALGISRATADEYWAYARAWLRVEIAKGDN